MKSEESLFLLVPMLFGILLNVVQSLFGFPLQKSQFRLDLFRLRPMSFDIPYQNQRFRPKLFLQWSLQFIFATLLSDCSLFLPVTQFIAPHRVSSLWRFSPQWILQFIFASLIKFWLGVWLASWSAIPRWNIQSCIISLHLQSVIFHNLLELYSIEKFQTCIET